MNTTLILLSLLVFAAGPMGYYLASRTYQHLISTLTKQLEEAHRKLLSHNWQEYQAIASVDNSELPQVYEQPEEVYEVVADWNQEFKELGIE